MNIGAAAKASGLPAKTIRYYEEIGLLTPARDLNGYRDFGDRDLHVLAFIGRARGLGFSIEQVRALLSLWQDRERASADVHALARTHLAEIDAKMEELREMRDTLAGLMTACAGNEHPDCPILEGLAGHADGCRKGCAEPG
ncbi:Cu(I)-responsive transcriptional regulator [Rhodovulum sp. DZ06]|uniref:Cu(I)-responsive transcriptional regulator n=1 Tax=Rhodovulum sp. DZ06 TaxID=3425126 RepID=UPI003D34AE4F